MKESEEGRKKGRKKGREAKGREGKGRGVPLLLIPEELIRARGFQTDPKQYTGSLLLNAS